MLPIRHGKGIEQVSVDRARQAKLPLEQLLLPHDLRRTFANLANKGYVSLEQIQMSLRHANIETTIRYVNPDQDFADPPGERFGLVIRRRAG